MIRFLVTLVLFSLLLLTSGKKDKNKDKCKNDKCKEPLVLSDKELKSCQKGEEKLLTCITDGTFLLDLTQYFFPYDLIEEHHKSTDYKSTMDGLVEDMTDNIIEEYLVSEELNDHLQGIFMEYNDTVEVQQLIESTVNASLANETKKLEEKFNDDISTQKKTDLKALDLIEELVVKLYSVFAERRDKYSSDGFFRSYLSTKRLDDSRFRHTEEWSYFTPTWSSRVLTDIDKDKYFNWNYVREYTLPSSGRIQDSPMNYQNWNYGPIQDSPMNHQNQNWNYGPIQDSPMNHKNHQIQNGPMISSGQGSGRNKNQMHKNMHQHGEAPGPNWGQYTVKRGYQNQFANAEEILWEDGTDTTETTEPSYEPNPTNYYTNPYMRKWRHRADSTTEPFIAIAQNPKWQHLYRKDTTTEPFIAIAPNPKWQHLDRTDTTTEPFIAIAPNPNINNSNNSGRQLPPKAKKSNTLINLGADTEQEEDPKSFDISLIKKFSEQNKEQLKEESHEDQNPKKNPGIDPAIKWGVLELFQQARKATPAPDSVNRPDMERKTERRKEAKSDATTLWASVSPPPN
ncbi:hypothetical protein ACHWQZ_G015146 [Mnemiopsis leidyi]